MQVGSRRMLTNSATFTLNEKAKESTMLREAIERFLPLIYSHGAVDDDSDDDDDDTSITEITVHVSDGNETYPSLRTDVSYTLSVPETGSIELSAATIYGIMNALQTLTQLVKFEPMKDQYSISSVPLHIK